MKTIRNKQALVTGAASGIGREIACALADEGANLSLVDIDEAGLASAAASARLRPVNVETFVADLRRPDELRSAIDSLAAPDILVNSIGVTYVGATELMTDAQWQEMLALNLEAPVRMTISLLPLMLSRPEGHIVNVCSFSGLVEHVQMAAYTLTKHALVGFSQALRLEYADRGLGVTALCPAPVRTNLKVMGPNGTFRRSIEAMGRIQTSPEKVAKLAVKAIREDHGIVIGGVPPHAAWLLKRICPAGFDAVYSFLVGVAQKDRTLRRASIGG